MSAAASARVLALALLLAALAGCAADASAPGPAAARVGPPAPPDEQLLDRFRIDAAPVSPEAPGTGAGAATPAAPAGDAPAAGAGPEAPGEVLHLEAVLLSVERHFPLILAAREERELAAGKAQAAAGAFDTRLGARGLFELEGFYESDRLDVSLEQPTTWWGSTFELGWRRGDGSFAVYDGKAKTNRDGELRAGASVPLLQGRSIDPQRVKLYQAALAQEQVDPIILEKRLEATRKAAATYWKWLAWGEKRRIAQRLLDLAEARAGQVAAAVREGELAEINLADNERLIVSRRVAWEEATQGLRRAAIELSLYWRGADGLPRVPDATQLPAALPSPRPLDEVLVPDAEALALARRPVLRRVELDLEQLRLERDLAENQTLPGLDLGVFASQDYGGAVNTPDDKGDFELEALVQFDLPIQRRKARGARREAEAKIAKLEHELRFVRDVVVSEVRDAEAVLEQTFRRLDQARRNVELALQLEEAERLQLELGESDLFRVNLREQQSALAESSLVAVLAEHFVAITDYRAVIAVAYDEILAGPLSVPP